MEDLMLREKFKNAADTFIEKIKKNKKCIAAFLMGSVSHDMIWEWSDLHIMLIFDDSYKGEHRYNIIEQDTPILITIDKKSEFVNYLVKTNVADYHFCDISKSTAIFIKDPTLKEYLDDIFYIGDRDREIEMLLGFSGAIYHLNKAEKNFRVKGNSHNAIYFLHQIAGDIAWIEVAKHQLIPERETITQAAELAPELFEKIYYRTIKEPVTDNMIDEIILYCHEYLKENTLEVYRPIISYLQKHGDLENFSMPTRGHGFGINYQWLYRMGIVSMYSEPVKIDKQDEYYKVGYKLNPDFQNI